MTDYATPAPSTVEGLADLLERLHLGRLDEASSPGGRSNNWLGTTTSGQRIFAKHLPRSTSGGIDAFTRTLAHAQTDRAGASPALLGADPATGLVVFNGLEGAESGVDRALARRFEPAMSDQVGQQLARVHAATIAPDLVDDEPSVMPPLTWLEGLPWAAVQTMNGAQLEAWRLLQNDPDVVAALVRLRAREQLAPLVPIHGDLRLDQVLVTDVDVQLCDWECFRLGDAARDLGAYIGEWIYHSVFRIFATDGDSAWAGGAATVSHEEVMARGNANLTDNAVQVQAFWGGYQSVRDIDDDLRSRAFAFAGWHVIDRFLAAAESQSSLHPVAKAAAGIGRAALVNPDTVGSLLATAPAEVTR